MKNIYYAYYFEDSFLDRNYKIMGSKNDLDQIEENEEEEEKEKDG